MPKFYNYILKRLFPGGGNPGQILIKQSEDDYDVTWEDIPEAGEGGTGQVGTKDVNEEDIGHQKMIAYNSDEDEIKYIQIIDAGRLL